MARTAVMLDEEEVIYFHKNYAYMWKKLNTAPYYVSGAGEQPEWIKDPWLLPSYVNLSKCLNVEFVPSMNIVNKIVQFYNANIKPEVDAYTFLHEKLEESDHIRSTESYADTSEICGMYYCYYYAGMENKQEIYGSLMKIQKFHDDTVIQMITGLTKDEDLDSMQIRALFAGKDISMEQYKKYHDHLDLAKRRTALYKGNVQMTPGMLTIQTQCEDRVGHFLSLRLPLAEDKDDQYLGSVGLAMLVSNRDLQIVKMGIVRADQKGLKPFSLTDEQLKPILAIQKTANEHIRFSFNDNALWNDMILSQAE